MEWNYFAHPAKLKESSHPYSTQKNEAINCKGASKCPKSRQYGKGRSYHFRWASTIGETNEGKGSFHFGTLTQFTIVGTHCRRNLLRIERLYKKKKVRMQFRLSKAKRKYGTQSAISSRRVEDGHHDDARAYESGVGCAFEEDNDDDDDDEPFAST